MEIEIKATIKAEEKPSLRAAFEGMTRKLMESAARNPGAAEPEMIKEIRKNVRALGCPLANSVD